MLIELLIIYWVTSTVLFFFPRLLHPKRTNKAKRMFMQRGKVAVSAHRGGMLENRENSLSAFKHSVKIGVQMLEMDVHKTKDDIIVVAHDPSLKRITGQDLFIRDVNYQDIGPYLEEIYCDYGVSLTKKNTEKEKPCTLDDFFALLQTTEAYVSLDVKTGQFTDIERILTLAVKYGVLDKVIIGMMKDFDTEYLRSKYGREVNFFFSAKSGFLLFFYFFTGLLPLVNLKYDFFHSPLNFKTLQKSSLFKNWEKMRLHFVFMDLVRPIFKLFIWHLQKRDIPVSYFVANEVEDFDMAIDCRANVIMTDTGEKLINYLSSLNYY